MLQWVWVDMGVTTEFGSSRIMRGCLSNIKNSMKEWKDVENVSHLSCKCYSSRRKQYDERNTGKHNKIDG